MHRSICVEEILAVLKPSPGETGLDLTLGFGGHTLAMLPLDALRKGRKAARYRWRMFVERLRHFSS